MPIKFRAEAYSFEIPDSDNLSSSDAQTDGNVISLQMFAFGQDVICPPSVLRYQSTNCAIYVFVT